MSKLFKLVKFEDLGSKYITRLLNYSSKNVNLLPSFFAEETKISEAKIKIIIWSKFISTWTSLEEWKEILKENYVKMKSSLFITPSILNSEFINNFNYTEPDDKDGRVAAKQFIPFRTRGFESHSGYICHQFL